MDGVREIIIEAGNILKDKYMSSFMVHEKEKGHLAAVWKDRLQEVIFFKKPEGNYQTTIEACGIIVK